MLVFQENGVVSMLNRVVLAAVALAVSVNAAVAAGDAKTKECPVLGLDPIADLIRQAPSCRRAMALFELCEFGTSGDIRLGAAVTRKCERDFLASLSAPQKRKYDGKQRRCARKYQHEDGTMYRSFEAFCGADVARDYSARFRGRK
jgi:hypothetical protein